MDFYRVTYSTYYNDECIHTNSAAVALLDEEPESKTFEFSWENEFEFFKTCGFGFPANVYEHKKGLVLEFYNMGLFGKKIKSWKDTNPNIKVTIEYKKFNPSIQRVLDWYDCERAIAYLNEKGLKIK